MTIPEKASAIATFRAVQVSCMTTLARWIPTTPEMEVKVLFGRHIWEVAQHANALGQRTYELRKPLHFSLPPAEGYARVLATWAAARTTAERVSGYYDVLLPGLQVRYQRYLAATDALLDAPTVRILQGFLTAAAQMQEDTQALCAELPHVRSVESSWREELAHMESALHDMVAPRAATRTDQDVQTVSIDPTDTMCVRGLTLRCDPAREPCFMVVHTPEAMHEYADMSEVSRRERLHRHMNNEIGSLEIAAQCLADFPAAPWELRMQLARQCWDETRHVCLLYRRLLELGGQKGEFPVANLEWTVTCMLDTLPARLAVQNRTFEAGQMDLLGQLVERWRAVGDETTAAMLEGILVDEIQHVRFANQWIKRMVHEDRRVLLQVAMAMRLLTQATAALAARPGESNAVGTVLGTSAPSLPQVNIEDRRHADFTDEEIRQILRQTGFPSLAATLTTQEVHA